MMHNYSNNEIYDDRLISWKTFLDINTTSNVLYIEGDADPIMLMFAENVNQLVFLNKDINQQFVLTEICQSTGHDNVFFINYDGKQLPINKEVFDIVVLKNDSQYNHRDCQEFPKIEMLITQTYTKLKKGGQFIHIVTNPLRCRNSLGRKTKKLIILKKVILNFFYLVYKIKNVLLECGLTEIKIIYSFRGPIGEAYCVYGK